MVEKGDASARAPCLWGLVCGSFKYGHVSMAELAVIIVLL